MIKKNTTFLLASNNEHKLSELKRILTPLGINVVTPRQYGIDLGEVEENGSTFAQNAKIKALHAYNIAKIPTVADDTGLMVDALGGKPGVYTARYAGENANDEDRMNKLLHELDGAAPNKRTAAFVTSICCIIDEETVIEVTGKCSGSIAMSAAGNNGFDYDPIFMTELGKTFAELAPEQKNAVSHRARALEAFCRKMQEDTI